MKTALFHGITAALFASIAACVYNAVYTELMLVDYSAVINIGSLIGASVFACVLASVGYYLLGRIVKKGADVLFNIVLLLASFASFIMSFYAELPLEVKDTEFFFGLSIPLHLFPALFWLATKPLYYK